MEALVGLVCFALVIAIIMVIVACCSIFEIKSTLVGMAGVNKALAAGLEKLLADLNVSLKRPAGTAGHDESGAEAEVSAEVSVQAARPLKPEAAEEAPAAAPVEMLVSSAKNLPRTVEAWFDKVEAAMAPAMEERPVQDAEVPPAETQAVEVQAVEATPVEVQAAEAQAAEAQAAEAQAAEAQAADASPAGIPSIEEDDEAELLKAAPQEPPAPAPDPEPSALERYLELCGLALKRALRPALDFLMKEGHIWVVAGVLVLLLGISFFVRYSIAMGWFTPPLRLAAASALGLALFVIGFKLKERRRGYGLFLQSGGLGVLYLTTVGAVRLYGILSAIPALGILSALVALTAVLALWQNAQLLAHVSVVAAFAAPLLVSSDSGGYVALFSFYCLINAGILAMSFFRPWRRLYLTGFILSFGIFALWAAAAYQDFMFPRCMPFLAAFYLFYAAMGFRVAPEKEAPKRRRWRADQTLTIAAPMVFLILAAWLSWRKPYTLASISFILGLIYITAARLVWRNSGQAESRRTALFLGQGVIYANLALPLAIFHLNPALFRPGWLLAMIWALEGGFIYYAGLHSKGPARRLFGLGLILLAAGLAVFNRRAVVIDWPLLTPRFLLTLVVTAVLMAVADAAARRRGHLADFERKTPEICLGLALAWLAARTTAEILRARAPAGLGEFLSLFLIAFSLQALALNLIRRLRPVLGELRADPGGPPILAWPSLLPLVPAVIFSGFYVWPLLVPQPADWGPLWGALETGAWAVFVLAALGLFFDSRLKLGQSAPWPELPWPVEAGGPGLCLAGLSASFAGGQLFYSLAGHAGLPAAWSFFARALPLMLLLCWLWRREADPRRAAPGYAALPIALAALGLWLFLALISHPAPASFYLPVLNAVDLTQAVLAVAPLAWLYCRLGRLGHDRRRYALYVMAGLGFIWLNLALGRVANLWLGAPYSSDGIFANNSFQAMAALVWAAVGITGMITGHRAGRRGQWLLGALLIGADLLKLFFIDLSRAETLTRVISFVCVGIFLILVGYYAPLPPKAAKPGLTGQAEPEELKAEPENI